MIDANVSEKWTSYLDLPGPRRALAITVMVLLFLFAIAVFPDGEKFSADHPRLKTFLDVLVVALGIAMTVLELRHSTEANDHRSKLNRLTIEANQYRSEANRLGAEALSLQVRVHTLQEEIERKLIRVRLYLRVRNENGTVNPSASNLSDFDLWVNQIRLVVTESSTTGTGAYVFGGGNRISRGATESGYRLAGKIMEIHGQRSDRVDMKFYLQVEAIGLADEPVTVNSPEYHLRSIAGRTELNVIRYNV